ncbi:18422_t:CDS:2 [Racocetra fulgida]|uniref:18422_t:CDS:1 n=1 Tax=Racocetra fulgida TaxID=60492 RepID=A0A9N9F9K7_9GLOM|nr:18422_t:CDS:2 [Racocetra fulgida]
MEIVDAVNNEIVIVRIGPNIRRYSEILYDKDTNFNINAIGANCQERHRRW